MMFLLLLLLLGWLLLLLLFLLLLVSSVGVLWGASGERSYAAMEPPLQAGSRMSQ
jgi:hypothetical protein